MKAVFLDRDATVNVGVPTYRGVDSVDKVELLPKTLAALQLLAGLEYGVFFVTNQAGIAEGRLTIKDFHEINKKVLGLIAPSGVKVIKTYFCPHLPDDGCDCRKPSPKLILDAATEYEIDLGGSWMIGDRDTDVVAGVNAGTRAILVKTGFPDMKSEEAEYTAPTLLEAITYVAGH